MNVPQKLFEKFLCLHLALLSQRKEVRLGKFSDFTFLESFLWERMLWK
jgi:hypothetical protein